ncbi:MAG: STAS/SEC14 domain-containing protein [Blastocatellia bacterium]
MPTAQIKSDQLLNAALQMPEDEFQRFVTRLFILKARQRTPTLSARESELLSKINHGLAYTDARRMRALIAKRDSYTITQDELQELIRLTDEAERLNVERIRNLVELAQLRGNTLDEVMEQLGIRPAAL